MLLHTLPAVAAGDHIDFCMTARVSAPFASAGYGRKDAAELLLDAGAQVEALNNDQQSPADAAKVCCGCSFLEPSASCLPMWGRHLMLECLTDAIVKPHCMTFAGQPRNAHGHIPEPESWQKAGVGEGDLLVAKHLFSSMVMVVCMIVHDSCSCLGQPHELSTAPGDGNALRAWQTFQHMDIPIPCRLPT